MLLDLNNRDWAILTIALATLLLGLSFSKVRRPVFEFLRTGIAFKIAALTVFGWFYCAAGVYLLKLIGAWSPPLLKDSLVWILLSSPAVAFRGLNQRNPNHTFRTLMQDQFKAILVFQLVFNTYTMSYWAELFWVLATSLLTLLILTVQGMRDGEMVAKFFNGLKIALGLGMLAFLSWSILHKPNEVFCQKGLQTFFQPILLSFWMLPLGYAVSVYAAYEMLFVGLKIGSRQPPDVRFYVRCRLFEIGGLNAAKLRRIDRLVGPRAGWPEDHDKADEMFASLVETLEDPDLDDAGDFVWPDVISRSDKPPFESMDEYAATIAPLLDEGTSHDAQARTWIAEYLSGDASRITLHQNFANSLPQVKSLSEEVASLPDCSRRIRKVDAPLQSYASSVYCLYRYVTVGFLDEEHVKAGDYRLRYFSDQCEKDWKKLHEAIERFCLKSRATSVR